MLFLPSFLLSSTSVVPQIGDVDTDHSYWGRPEQQSNWRPVQVITSSGARGADIVGEVRAIAFAQGFMRLRLQLIP